MNDTKKNSFRGCGFLCGNDHVFQEAGTVHRARQEGAQGETGTQVQHGAQYTHLLYTGKPAAALRALGHASLPAALVRLSFLRGSPFSTTMYLWHSSLGDPSPIEAYTLV